MKGMYNVQRTYGRQYGREGKIHVIYSRRSKSAFFIFTSNFTALITTAGKDKIIQVFKASEQL